MSINDNILFGQLTLPEPEPTIDASTIKLNRALAGFLADPFAVERAHIELYARTAEQEGKARSTIGRRLSTVCGFYRYCEQERLVDRDPGAHVRRPKQDYESTTLGLDRNELGAFLVQAGLSGGRDHALASLLALNGLRISEALAADIENLDVNRGHRTLFIRRKGQKTATIPLAPRTARALDLYIGERQSGPIFLNAEGTARLDRHASARIVRRLAKRAGIDKWISPHSLRHSFITAALDAGSHSATCKKQHHTRTRERRCATTEAVAHLTVTPPTSCRPSSQAPAAERYACRRHTGSAAISLRLLVLSLAIGATARVEAKTVRGRSHQTHL